MEVQCALRKLADDLHDFKSIARNLTDTNQHDALQALDTVILTDKTLQQAISAGK
jgi:hypothetical protein